MHVYSAVKSTKMSLNKQMQKYTNTMMVINECKITLYVHIRCVKLVAIYNARN